MDRHCRSWVGLLGLFLNVSLVASPQDQDTLVQSHPRTEKTGVLYESVDSPGLGDALGDSPLMNGARTVEENTVDLWSEASRFPGGWCYLDWFGWFSILGNNWITHAEHGYLYCIGKTISSISIYDYGMASWIWISNGSYPNLYKFGENAGWYWYFTGGEPGNRWFVRLADYEYVQESVVNDPVNAYPNLTGFSLISAGSFTMGSPVDEPGHQFDEDQHTVTLTRSFYLQKMNVTWTRWNEVRDWALNHGYTDLASGYNDTDAEHSEEHPVIDISWYEALKWLNALSEKEGLSPCYRVDGLIMRTGEAEPSCDFDASGYRLPTESEWEYACRAGTTTAFYNGPIIYTGELPVDPNMDKIGWFYANSDIEVHPVGRKEENAWGLYDMSGNVYDWCWDRYGTYPGDVTNPEGPTVGTRRVARGGYYGDYAQYCRSAYRHAPAPQFGFCDTSIRPARTASH